MAGARPASPETRARVNAAYAAAVSAVEELLHGDAKDWGGKWRLYEYLDDQQCFDLMFKTAALHTIATARVRIRIQQSKPGRQAAGDPFERAARDLAEATEALRRAEQEEEAKAGAHPEKEKKEEDSEDGNQ